ncbi:hypothetical protein LCGC14_2176390 [marine sediment metagenome]|uniref:Uncharacterized protein n=1 Tax=marine sediment metagenome TaxID=412755 RepID=A0A0F9DNM7_9ZZZZ
MNEQITNNQLAALENELVAKDSKINELSNFAGNTVFSQAQDNNLIVWQLELDNILERIEHLLRGDIVKEDEEGNIIYTQPNDKGLIILNDYGVGLIMNIISFYLNRNTILSDYMPDRIYEILFDLGNELSDVIYINYEKMGMDSIQKKSRSEILVINILHTIESAYNRALKGGERDSLRSARVVTQTQPIGGVNQMMQMQRPKARGGILNPMNWNL